MSHYRYKNFNEFGCLFKSPSTQKKTKKFTNVSKVKTNSLVLVWLLLWVRHTSIKSQPQIQISYFYFPVKKKSTIFLRAPYKNKLARISIVQRIYKLGLFISTTSNAVFTNKTPALQKYLHNLYNLNFSTTKSTHTKTTANTLIKNTNYFYVTNYLK